MTFTRTEAERLQRDYIPRGKPISDWRDREFRRADEHEIYQCGRRSSYDPQSGWIFCGRVATFLHFVEGGVLALCAVHKPPKVAND